MMSEILRGAVDTLFSGQPLEVPAWLELEVLQEWVDREDCYEKVLEHAASWDKTSVRFWVALGVMRLKPKHDTIPATVAYLHDVLKDGIKSKGVARG